MSPQSLKTIRACEESVFYKFISEKDKYRQKLFLLCQNFVARTWNIPISRLLTNVVPDEIKQKSKWDMIPTELL